MRSRQLENTRRQLQPERCNRTRGPAEAQRGAGASEARSGIEPGFVSSTVGSGLRRQPAATSSHCVLESQGRFEEGDWRRIMRISLGILSFAALSVLDRLPDKDAEDRPRAGSRSGGDGGYAARSSPAGVTPARFVRTPKFNWHSRNRGTSPLSTGEGCRWADARYAGGGRDTFRHRVGPPAPVRL